MAFPRMFDLRERVAAVTGGNRGMGRGIALGLAQAGAAVAVLARNQDNNRAVAEEVRKLGVPALALALDVRKRADLQPAIAEVERTLGPLDILVNNAGIAIAKGALEADEKSWNTVIETNLTSVFLLAQIAERSMMARRRGKISNLASEYAIFGERLIPAIPLPRGPWCS